MAKLKDLKVTIGLSKRGLTKLNADLRRTKSNFRRNFGEIAQMAKRAAAVIATTLVAGVTALVKAGADMEKLEVGFRSITGGAREAAKMVSQLNEFAASTPFQLENISRAARQLLAVGVAESDLTKELRMLGDIAAASGNQIEDIAAIFAKVQAKGKVELENLNQLAERGIPIFDKLREVTGDANMEFGAGAVSVQEFNDALKGMVEQGGFAKDSMEQLSRTTHGLATTLMDNLGIALSQAADRSGLMDHINMKLTLAIAAVQGTIKTTAADVDLLKDAFGDLMGKALKPTTSNIDELEDGFVGLEAGLKKAISKAQEGSKEYSALNAMLEEVQRTTVRLNQAVLAGLPAGAPPPAAPAAPTRPQDMASAMSISASSIQRSLNDKVLQPLLDISYILDEIATEKVRQMERAQMQMAMTLSSTFQSVFSTLLSGTQSFGEIMKRILQDLMVKLVSMVAAFAAISVLTGGTKGAAGLGAFMKAGFGIPQMAQGGLFTGASLAMVGEGPGTSMINPEVVAPLDKLQQMMGGGNVTVTGRLDGRDILISSERAGFDRNRVRGI
jgi:hypothetical protein